MSRVKSPSAFEKLSTEHARKQLETLTKQLATLAQDWKESRRGAVLAMAASAMLSAALAKPQEMQAPLNDTKSTEVRIVSSEFRYAPAKVWVTAGRPVTLVLDNSGAETEHGIFLPAFGFRLMAKTGEINRKSVVFDKPGEYEFACDLPGHREAGMKGTLIVSAP
jgi:plastocyanin